MWLCMTFHYNEIKALKTDIAHISSGHISGLPSLYPDRIRDRITVFGRLEYGISPSQLEFQTLN